MSQFTFKFFVVAILHFVLLPFFLLAISPHWNSLFMLPTFSFFCCLSIFSFLWPFSKLLCLLDLDVVVRRRRGLQIFISTSCLSAAPQKTNTQIQTDTRTHVVEQIHDYDKYEMDKCVVRRKVQMFNPTHYVWPHSVSIIEQGTPTRYSFQFTVLLIFFVPFR